MLPRVFADADHVGRRSLAPGQYQVRSRARSASCQTIHTREHTIIEAFTAPAIHAQDSGTFAA